MMLNENEYLATVPFDLYELSLFHLVATHRSFTRAGQLAGLTQSAITRQIRAMETSLGVALFERTTRHVALTAAGELLSRESAAILQSVNHTIERLNDKFDLAPKTIRVGISRSIGLACLPGFFFAYQRKFPAIQIQVVHQSSRQILDALEAKEIDVGLLSPPRRIAQALQVTHRFADDFTLIVPPNFRLPAGFDKATPDRFRRLLAKQRCLLIDGDCNTGKLLRDWFRKHSLSVQPAMELDSFDLIVNLVSLGMGISIVPQRTMSIYLKSRSVQRIPMKPRFSRELAVVVRKNRNTPEHIRQFIENILY